MYLWMGGLPAAMAPHTLGWPAHRWRVLDSAHQKRNLAEYEGYLDIEESLVLELTALVRDLIADVETLTR
jgi:hypothetical protein